MSWLSEQYVRRPDVTALYAKGESLTFRQLYERASGAARRLERQYVLRPGDRVATLMGNTISHAVLLHALMLLRVTLVPLNLRLCDDEIKRQAAHAGIKLLLTDQNQDEESAEYLAGARFPESGEDDILSIIFTSGTSRHPKAVPHSYRNYEAGALASAANLGVRANDNWLCPLPLYHIGGLAILIRSVIYGTAVTLLNGFEEQPAVRMIREHDISIVSFVPTMLHRVLLVDPDFTASSLPALRVILLGGGPAGDVLRREIQQRGLPVLGTYGLTETCSQVTTMRPGQGGGLSAGKPLGDAEIVIRDSDGRSCPTGEQGEIHIRGSMLTIGYRGDEELNDRMFVGGWFRSGDIGFIDDSGNLHVLSRREDLIVSGGENVLPSEVEDRIQMHPGVREAAVVGLEDEEWGQVVAAVIVPDNEKRPDEAHEFSGEAHEFSGEAHEFSGEAHEFSGEAHEFSGEAAERWSREFEQWCRASLAGYKIPHRWLFLRELPRTSSGKIRREHLRRLFD